VFLDRHGARLWPSSKNQTMADGARRGPIHLAPLATREELQLNREALLDRGGRNALERRARLLGWGGNAWNVVEVAIAVGAGIAAGSVALVGFGIDSVIEALAGGVIVWLFSGGRGMSLGAEQRAQQLIAVSYVLLVTYIGVEAARDLVGSHRPEVSWVGIGLAAFTAPTMPFLARAKRTVGRKLNSSATVSEASQNMVCAYLSIALLVGLLANALLGWWWADPVAALAIAVVAGKEGMDAWRGESCDCC
jgi:divalent metal cation (Fe/Co/Zn/Cd) transporter